MLPPVSAAYATRVEIVFQNPSLACKLISEPSRCVIVLLELDERTSVDGIAGRRAENPFPRSAIAPRISRGRCRST